MAALWPPLLVIHGGVDRVVSANNGQAAVRVWANAAGARPVKGRTLQRGKRYPMTVTDFKLRSSTVATLVEVEKLGHAWSGGAANQPYSDGQGPGRLAHAVGVRRKAVFQCRGGRMTELNRAGAAKANSYEANWRGPT